MADSSNETSKTIRFRSLRFMNQAQTSTDYELPSLRAKPRQRQNNDSDSSDNDSNTDTGDDSESERDELLDSEDSELEQDSDDGSVFSMDEADDLDNEEELTSPTRSRDRQRRRQRQQNDTLAASSNVNSLRKRQRGNNHNRSEQTPPSNSSTTSTHQHPPKRRKLRPSHTIRSATIYNDLLSDDSEWMDQDFGIQYTNDMDTVRNGRRRKSTTTSPLVLGSPSKVIKSPAASSDGGCKQQPADEIHNSAVFLSPNRIQHSCQSSSSTATTTHGTSPLSRLDEKKWPRRPQASVFLDKLQAKEEDTLDLSQHSFIPDDFLEHAVATPVAATAAAGLKTTGDHSSLEVKTGQQPTLSVMDNDEGDDDDDSDAPMHSNDTAYQYDFSTISEPSSMAITPTGATMMDDHDDTHTHQISTNPPTPTPTPVPNTTQDEPRPAQPNFFRRIISFLFS